MFDFLQKQIDSHDIVLYMKGTKENPMCGFSKLVVQILDNLNVKYLDVDVLVDPELREGIKHFTNWPTIPQLYIYGDFVGGADIIREIYNSGDLLKIINKTYE